MNKKTVYLHHGSGIACLHYCVPCRCRGCQSHCPKQCLRQVMTVYQRRFRLMWHSPWLPLHNTGRWYSLSNPLLCSVQGSVGLQNIAIFHLTRKKPQLHFCVLKGCGFMNEFLKTEEVKRMIIKCIKVLTNNTIES